MGLISEKMKFDFLVRLKFDISEGYDKAGIKTAYNDFARTLRTDNLKEKKSKTEKFLLKELKELISLDIKNKRNLMKNIGSYVRNLIKNGMSSVMVKFKNG